MRIAIATTSYPSETGDPSGHFVRSHARILANDGAEVVVFTPGRPTRDEEIAGAGIVRVIRLGGQALFSWPGAAARAREAPARLGLVPLVAARAVAAIRREGPFDRAVAHWIPSAHVFSGLEVPLHVVAHGADVRLLLRAPRVVRERVVGALLGRGARVQFVASALQSGLAGALSRDLARDLAARSFVEAAPFELPAPGTMEDPRAALGMGADARYVAWLGRLVPAKRPELAIEAARLAGRTLVIVGDGPLLAQIARPPWAAGVVLAGRLSRDRALAVMSRASAVLHTSSAEGASTVVREARALGVPVVACAAGDLATWAARDEGISMAEPDAPAIAKALERAFTSARSIAHHGAAP